MELFETEDVLLSDIAAGVLGVLPNAITDNNIPITRAIPNTLPPIIKINCFPLLCFLNQP